MARRNDEIQGRNKRVKVEEQENSKVVNDETKVSFTVDDLLDGRCTVTDLAADILRDVESAESLVEVDKRLDRAKERLEKIITRLEMEAAHEPPLIILALKQPRASPYGLSPPPAVAPPPAAPAPGGEPRD